MVHHLARTSVAAALVAIVVAASVPAGAQPAKQTPPAGGTPRPFVLPEPTRFALPNGLQVTLVPYGTVPKTTVSLIVGVGNVHERADQVWLADLTGELLREGTASRTAAQVAEAAGGMGGTLTVSVGGDQTAIALDVLSDAAPAAVALVAEVTMRPALPAAEVARVRDNLIRQLTVARSTPGSLAAERFAATLYPDHSYGRLFPSEAQLSGYDLAAAQTFHRTHFVPNRSHLYVVGQFDAGAVRASVERSLGAWARGTEVTPPRPEAVSARSFHLVDRPGAPQSTIRLGLPVVDPSHKDYVALQVTNALLGGSFASRITSNIREQKGYTYSPTSQLASHPGVAHWVQLADVTTAVTGAALTEIFSEVERLRSDAPSEEELAGFRNYLGGVFVLQNSSRAGITNQLAFTQLHRLGADHLETYVSRVQAVTPADVQRVARDYLMPDRMTLVVVGDAANIRGQLSAFETRQ